MDSAIYTKLETIIDAKDLKLLSELDKDGFICEPPRVYRRQIIVSQAA